MKKYIYITSVLLLLACGGSKDAVEDTRFKRKPLVEVPQQQLDLEAMMVSAKMQQEVGKTSEAMEQYRNILRKSAGYAPACYEISGLMLQEYRLDSALAYAQKAAGSDPDNVWYQRRLADLYMMKKDGRNLAETWEAIVKKNPTTLEYYYELSNAYLMDNKIPKSVEVLDRVEKMIGVSEMVSLQKHRLWEAYGKPDKALAELEKLSDAMPQMTKYSAVLAQQYMERKQYDKAKRYYDRIVEQSPDDEYVHISLASYYKAVNQPEMAYEELKKGFMNSSLDASSKIQILGSFYTDEEFFGSCAKYTLPLLDLVISQSDDKSAYALPYAGLLMHQNQYAQAAEQFEIALQKDSSEYEVWEALLICLSESKDDQKMADYAQRAQKLFPLHALPYYLLGFADMNQGRYAEGEEQLRQCVKLGFPKGYLEAETYGLLATCLYEQKKEDEAYACLDHYLKLRPDDAGMKNNYAYYLSQSGIRLDEARKMAEEAVAAEPKNGIFLDTYAWVLYKMGLHKEALKQIEKALELAPDRKALQEHYQQIKKAQ